MVWVLAWLASVTLNSSIHRSLSSPDCKVCKDQGAGPGRGREEGFVGSSIDDCFRPFTAVNNAGHFGGSHGKIVQPSMTASNGRPSSGLPVHELAGRAGWKCQGEPLWGLVNGYRVDPRCGHKAIHASSSGDLVPVIIEPTPVFDFSSPSP